MTDNKITTEGLFQDSHRSVHKHLRLYIQRPHSPKQQAIRFDNPILPPISLEQENRILNIVADLMVEIDAVIVVDYSKGIVTPRVITEISKIVNNCGKVCAGDSRYQVSCFQDYTVITPNDQEAIAAVRHCDPAEVTAGDISNYTNVKNAGSTLLEELGLNNLVITRGGNGMSIFRKGEVKDIPVVINEVLDPIGAGDTAIAAMVLSLCSGADIVQAAAIASHAASIVVGKPGTATVSQDELLDSIAVG